MASKHKWQRKAHPEEVEGVTQAVKNCASCGMSRTRDRSTKSLDLFRKHGSDRWEGFRAGHIPPCERQPKPAGGEGA